MFIFHQRDAHVILTMLAERAPRRKRHLRLALPGHHALDERGLAFKYLLRLLTIEQARRFESHLAGCDRCSGQLAEVTNFFELLRKALNARPATASTNIAETDIEREVLSLGASSMRGEEFIQLPPNLDQDRLIEIFTNCFAGFQKLRSNIADRIGAKVEMDQIDQAAIEILIALPHHVSKIDSQS